MSERMEQRLRLVGLALAPAPGVEDAALAAAVPAAPARRSPRRRRGLLAAAVAVPLVVSLAVWAAVSRDSPDYAVIGGAGDSARWPAETWTDVVSYADQLSAVTVLSEEQLPISAEEEAAGEGYMGRSVVLRIGETFWRREDAPLAVGQVQVIPWGWTFEGDRLTPAASSEGPRLEVGRRYVLALVRAPRDGVEWTALSDSSTFPFDGERITTEGLFGDPSSLLEEVAGMTPEEVGALLARTPPDPLAYEYRHLDPDERLRRVFPAQDGAG